MTEQRQARGLKKYQAPEPPKRRTQRPRLAVKESQCRPARGKEGENPSWSKGAAVQHKPQEDTKDWPDQQGSQQRATPLGGTEGAGQV